MDHVARKDGVLKVLDELGIVYSYLEHPPAMNMEEVEKHWAEIEGMHCKNIFFRNKKGKRHVLVVLSGEKKLDVKFWEQELKSGRLSFASAKRLMKYLGLEAGAVSPFGLINDGDNHVEVLLDSDMQGAGKVSFHPNVNTATVTLEVGDFIRYMDWVGNSYRFVKV